jgi:hypothetical protein
MVSIMSSFLGPTFVPEDLESVLVIAAEGAEVEKEFYIRNGYSLIDS